MTNKRLLAILVVFIVVAGLAVATGSIFRVRQVDIRFTNDLFFLQEYEASLLPALHNRLDFVVGRSSLFGIDRDRITNEIENHDPRVRVTNIEVFAPNRLEVRIRERYPVFRFGRYALDMNLRYVTRATVVGTRPLVDITNQIDLPEGTTLTIGDFIGDKFDFQNEIETLRINRLQDIASLFWGQGLREDGVTNLITSIDFTYYLNGEPEMTLNFRNEENQHAPPVTKVTLSDISVEYNFRAMLTHVWDVKAQLSQMTGHYVAWVDGNGRVYTTLFQ